ncbi:MAG: cell division protein ZapA [Flavipsychrobacter sp.]
MANEEELIPINVWLAERSYRIRVTPDEEESVRKAVKIADEKITELRGSYAGKDDQDFIAMCLLMYATDSAEDTKGTPSVYIEEEVKSMINRIDSVL